MFLPSDTGAFKGTGGVRHLLHPLVTDFGQPEFDRLGLGAGNTLDEAQQGLGMATSVSLSFPSSASIFNWLQFVTVWLPSS
jgi:hypothetical protein